ncbi:MAG: TetR family transcriptional regulator [Peptostreptococcaceae bacterium]|nr:TetR family transcriptional regulator [Peptostreptococcaceae bacterium]
MKVQITEQQKKAIELLAKQPFTNMTMDDIALECDTTRRTIYRWKEKFSKEIGQYSAENMGLLKPQLFATASQLLNSVKTSDKKAGAELYMRLEERYKEEVEATETSIEVQKASAMIKTIMEVLNITDKDDFMSLSKILVDMMLDKIKSDVFYYEKLKHMTKDEMLDSLTI